MDSQYLKQSIGPALTEALTSLIQHINLPPAYIPDPSTLPQSGIQTEYTFKKSTENVTSPPHEPEPVHAIPTSLDAITYIANYLIGYKKTQELIKEDKAIREERKKSVDWCESVLKGENERKKKFSEEVLLVVERREREKVIKAEEERVRKEKEEREEMERIEREKEEKERVEREVEERERGVGDVGELKSEESNAGGVFSGAVIDGEVEDEKDKEDGGDKTAEEGENVNNEETFQE
ncbi:hypothetical protein HK098_000191 [Nowakowskiella sp. JEL0407]|nr:hypothetical protein HK098_000191 [Nowakowskiella sp. JEL0407]